MIACRSGSPIDGNKTAPQIGSNDFWVVKTDANGNIQWQETYGGSAAEDFKGVSQTSDGGYILVGDSGSTNGDVSEAARGLTDYWMIKIDAVGTKQWDKRFGGTTNSLNFALNKARFAFETDDNGYMIGGLINSNMTGGDITEGVIGENDMWVVKTDATGNMVWDQRLGTADADDCNHGIQTADGRRPRFSRRAMGNVSRAHGLPDPQAGAVHRGTDRGRYGRERPHRAHAHQPQR